MLLDQLNLSVQQMQQIVTPLENIQRRLVRIAQLRQNMYDRNRSVLHRTRRSMALGRQPSQADEGVLSRALERLQRRVAAEEKAIDRLTAQIEAVFTPRQLALIETQEQRDLRRERLEALRGHTSAAGFIVEQIAWAKDLPQDEYQRRRQPIAIDIADRTEGLESSRRAAFIERLLGLMDELYALPPAEFARRRVNLETEVATHLDLRPEADVPSLVGKIAREDYTDLLRNRRTAVLLREMIDERG